jgi:UDP:flavonoid glycosyltransferase YjiC (YdhE family)
VLLPKPKDWATNIDIAGFFFLSSKSGYTPPDDLAAFLASGPPPVYIGFGSIVVDDPNAMTGLIFEAIRETGQRAIMSKGWGGLGAGEMEVPDSVFMVGDCPHDWLFERVSCVVHHGGAGTTAIGLACGKPTVIVPFFGDQPFWGSIVAKADAGPAPVPYKELTVDKLVAAIRFALEPQVRNRARDLAAKICAENGVEAAVQSFHRQLRGDSIRCMFSPSRCAVWRIRRTKIQLSTFAATTLSNEGILDLGDLKL